MSTLFWITILIIAIAVFIFVIVPWAQTPVFTLKPAVVAPVAAPVAPVAAPAEDPLAKFYKPAPDCVYEDHPRREIGACPESKAMSSALPISNVPLCVARQGDNLRLDAARGAPFAVSV